MSNIKYINLVKRLDHSLLYHGAIVALEHVYPDDAQQYYYSQGFDRPFAMVDYLVRNGANSYYAVCKVDGHNTVDVDTQHIRRVIDNPGMPKRGDVRIYDESHIDIAHRSVLATADDLRESLGGIVAKMELRANHKYLLDDELPHFLLTSAMYFHPRPGAYPDRTKLYFLKYRHNSSISYFAKALSIAYRATIPDSDGLEAEGRFTLLDIDLKRFRKWLKRHQSMFYTSSHKLQAVEDYEELQHQLQQEAQDPEPVAEQEPDLEEDENEYYEFDNESLPASL